GVLIQISLGYPPLQGRLHTRYAPVRRSQGSKLPLPLDLHVLSLPLAFILSQDQTLHRIFLYFRRILTLCKSLSAIYLTLFFFVKNIAVFNGCQFNMSMNVSSCFSYSAHLSISGCKSKHLLFTNKTFFELFLDYFFYNLFSIQKLRLGRAKIILFPFL